MDNDEKNHIQHNLPQLITNTSCTSMFLAHLVANSALSDADIDELNGIRSPTDKSALFYRIIVTRQDGYVLLYNALHENLQTGATKILEQIQTTSLFKPQTSTTGLYRCQQFLEGGDPVPKKSRLNIISAVKSISFDVRLPVKLFTGRQSYLQELHKLLQRPQNRAIVSQATSVTGLGGIGKSELCRAYINQHREDYDGNVIWINSDSEGSMAQSFRRFSKDVLKISTKDVNGEDKSPKSIVDEVYNFFAESKSLFVFDNAEKGDHLDLLMPTRILKPPYVLITSRDREWGIDAHVLVIQEFTEVEAIKFVKTGLKIEGKGTDETILRLVTTLQRFPLALYQAVSYIQVRQHAFRYTIEQYLQNFESNAKSVLKVGINDACNFYKDTTYTTWRITTNTIANDVEHGELAILILNYMAYLEPDRIHFKLISALVNKDENGTVDTLLPLIKYSMIESQSESTTFSIHRLVQEVTRIELRDCSNEEFILSKLLKTLRLKLKDDTVSHVLSAFRFATKYEKLMQEFSDLPGRILKRLHNNHRHTDFIEFGKVSLQLLQTFLSHDHAHVIKIEYECAVLDYNLKKYEESLRRFRAIHEILENERSKVDTVDHLTVQHFIARIFRRQGNFQESSKIMHTVLNDTIARYGEYNVKSINVYHHCAKLEKDLGNYQAALNLYTDVIEKYKQCLGESNRQVIVAQHNLSMLHFNMGRLDRAIHLSRIIYENVKGLIATDKTFLQNHTVGHTHAYLLCIQGSIEEADEIAHKMHELKIKAVGPDSIDTLPTLNVIGNVKAEKGKYEEALLIHRKVYSGLKQHSGCEDQQELAIKLDMAIVLSKIGMYDESLVNMQEVLRLQLAAHGPIHHLVFHAKFEIAKVLESMKRFKDALILFEDIAKNLRSTFGNQHFRLIEIEESISRIRRQISMPEHENSV